MNDNYNSIKDARLVDIPLIGSHDSSAYTFDFTKNIGLLSPIILSFINSVAPLKNFITIVSQTQNMTIYEQLCTGVRILDLRIQGSYGHHTIATIPAIDIFDQIYKFLTENPNEIVVLYFTFSDPNINYGSLRSLFANYHNETFDQLIKANKRCIVSNTPLTIPPIKWYDKTSVQDINTLSSTTYNPYSFLTVTPTSTSVLFMNHRPIYEALQLQQNYPNLRRDGKIIWALYDFISYDLVKSSQLNTIPNIDSEFGFFSIFTILMVSIFIALISFGIIYRFILV
jgi:hypothetical protein